MKIKEILVNDREKPQDLGVDPVPTLSWQIESEQKYTLQTAYRIKLFVGQKMIFDSGRVEGRENSFVELNLDKNYTWQSLTTYRVSLQVWDNYGNSAQAETNFATSLLNPKFWQGKWRKVNRPYQERKRGFGKQPGATLFRQEVNLLAKPIKEAKLFATALGVYEIYVNGQRPDRRALAPDFTAYHGYLNFQEYDVTKLLNEKENVIGMHVGDGWYCGARTMPPLKNLKPDHAVLFQLMVKYADGSQQVIGSDKTMICHPSPVCFSDLFDGDKYDQNLEIENWNKLGLKKDSQWKATLATEYPYQNLHPQIASPVQEQEIIKSVRLLHAPNGDQVIDFGQVMAGVLRVKIDEPKGTVITLEHTEVLDKVGNYFINTQGPLGLTEQKDEIICSGKAFVFEPKFTYHGFRYVRVKGIKNIDLNNFEAIVLSSSGKNLGNFETSNPDLNQLYHNIRWSQKSNIISIPTDCPQREKAGWTGDIWVYGQTALENADENNLFTQWLKNLYIDQKFNKGIVTNTVPDTAQYHDANEKLGMALGSNGICNSAAWGDAAVHLPWVMYKMTGNKQILKQQYESMHEWVDYIIKQAHIRRKGSKLPDKIEKHLWNVGFQFGEWLIPSQAGQHSMEETKKILLQSSIYTAPLVGYLSVHEFAQIACLLDKRDDAKKYKEEAVAMKYAIQNGGVIDKQGNMPSDLMGAYVLPIAFDLVPSQFRRKFADNLVRKIKENHYCLDTGFVGTPFLLPALCKIGRQDLAFDLLFQTKVPSWLAEVKHGATTIWESWVSYDKNDNPLHTSFNHYAYGVVGRWMFEQVAGLRQSKQSIGYHHLIFAPSLDKRIKWAKRSYETTQGLAGCDWQVKNDQFTIRVQVPANSTAEVHLPDGRIIEIGSGQYRYSCCL